MMYLTFSVGAVFMEKFSEQNYLFSDFSKNTHFVGQITNLRMRLQIFFLFSSRSNFRWLCHGIQDLKELEIEHSLEEIKVMSKYKFTQIIRKKAKNKI